MELICTDDPLQAPALLTALDLCPLENTISEVQTEDTSSKVLVDSNESKTVLITQSENLNSTSFKMSDSFIFSSSTATTDKDLKQRECCDRVSQVASHDGAYTSLANDSSALSTALLNAPASVAPTIETLTGHSVIASGVSFNSDDNHAAGLTRSLSRSSNDSDSDVTAARLSDLYIFESEAHDFILSPEPNPQGIKCSQSMSLSQTVTEISFKTHEAGDSSKAGIKYDLEFSSGDQIIVQCESDGMDSLSLRPPVIDVCDVAQENDEDGSKTMRNDSPVELWLDACQYFSVDDLENRNVTTSDYVSPEETQRSGYSQNASDMIGWTFDDKSWGPPVERWSSVDSWASALSDWAEIIASPAEDLTAAFTEIGAEIDALTQALAEVTTQIETELQSEKAENVFEKSIMGVQDKLIQHKEGIESMCTRKEELGKDNSSHPESKEQFMRAREVTTSKMYSQDNMAASVVSKAASEAGSSLLDKGFDSFKTDVSNEVTLNIVEDTDLEYNQAHERLQINEPNGANKCKVKNDASHSLLDLVPEQDIEGLCAPQEALNVTQQRNKVLGLPFVNTHTCSNVHVPEENSEHSFHVHVQPNTLADFDGACQVESLWGSPKFIIPLAPLNIGSSLVTQATNSSLNGETARLVLNQESVFVSSEVLDYWTESDEETEISSESTEDIAWSKQCSTDLKTDEASLCSFTESKSIYEESRDLLNLSVLPEDNFIVCEEKQVAFLTLDLYDPFVPLVSQILPEKMPHKTHKSSIEGKTRFKKERSGGQPHGANTSRNQENQCNNVEEEKKPHTCKENLAREKDNRLEHSEPVIESVDAPQKEMGRRHSKKKKKHPVKNTTEILTEVENEAKTDKAKTDILKDKCVTNTTEQSGTLKKNIEKQETKTVSKDKPSQNASVPNINEDTIKKRRLSQDKFGKLVSSLELKLTKGDAPNGAEDKAGVGATRRKAYSEVVKQKSVKPTDPKVVQPIQAVTVSGDPQSLCLWCQFSDVLTDYTVTWRKDRTTLTEIKRSAGDESRVSLTVSNASHKDLGKYQCELKSPQRTITLEFPLTYELLSEIVLPTTPKTPCAVPVEVDHEEENVHCSRLMFKEDFLVGQYFGESHSASIVTEKIHFGEGMHRRAFRTTLQAGQVPSLVPGDACVLKVHNAISYGTKDNEELVQKNFSLAVEECQVQNTAREYIRAYTAVAKSFDAFGPVPEIIPIYLVHRPSNDIPYATLEEELIGDFVKYSVKDGKEINLMRRDSEAGQKCCAFQHWVFHNTEGNLLVTDMQGVGMRLTDVGIATCKKGYKGFKGNCATSFIDQFKALHQCNAYCEILGLKSLQPKPKKMAPAPKSKAQPGATPKKKMFEPTVKGKS